MSDSLLQPGETLGATVTQPQQQSTQQPDPNAGLLRAGESFGPTVQAAATPPAAPEQPGFLNRMWNTSMIGQGAEAGKSIYQHRADELHAALGYMANGDMSNAVKTAVKLIPFVDPKSPEMEIIKSIATMPVDEMKKSLAEQRKGNNPGMVKHAAEAILPPFASNIEAGAEDIKNKNYSGLAGDVAGAGINAALLRSGLKEKAPAVEKPGLIDRATGVAGDLYDKATGAATDAAKGAARQAGQAAVTGAIEFGKGAVDAVSTRISSALRNAIDSATKATTPEEAAGSLRDLRANVRESLTGTGLPPEVITEILDKTVDEYYVNTHSVSGGADAAAAPAPEGEIQSPTTNYKSLRDLGYTDSQINKMTPETETNALNGSAQGIMDKAKNFAQEVLGAVDVPEGYSVENYLKQQGAKGAFRGAAAGGLGGSLIGHPLEGTTGGFIGGAAYGVGSPLAKAAIKVLVDDYGFLPADAVSKVGDYYQRVSHSAVGNTIRNAVDVYNGAQVNMAGAGIIAGQYIGQAVRAASGTIANAFDHAVEAAKAAPDQAVSALQGLRETARQAVSTIKGMTPDAVNHIVDRIVDEYHARTIKGVSGGAPETPPDTQGWINSIIDPIARTVSAAKEAAIGQPVGKTDVAAAARLPGVGPEVAAAATKGQMVGGGTLAFENWLRKSPTAGRFLNKTYDAQGRAMAAKVAGDAVDSITGRHMTSEEAGQVVQETLVNAGTQTLQGLMDTVNTYAGDAASKGIPIPVDQATSTFMSHMADRVAQQVPPEYRAAFDKLINAPASMTLEDALASRMGIQAAWTNGTISQLEMRNASLLLDRDVVRGLRQTNPQAAAHYEAVAQRATSYIDSTYSEVYKQAMRADPAIVFDKMLDAGTNEFLAIRRAVGDAGLKTIQQGLAQRILERSVEDSGLNADLLKRLTQKNAAKLGDSFDQLNTLHKGLAEMEKSWNISKTSAAIGRGYTGSFIVKGVFALAGAILGGEPLVGAMSGLGLEMMGERMVDYATKVTAKALMKPGTLDNMNIVMRAYTNATRPLPSEEVEGAAREVANQFKGAVNDAVREYQKQEAKINKMQETPSSVPMNPEFRRSIVDAVKEVRDTPVLQRGLRDWQLLGMAILDGGPEEMARKNWNLYTHNDVLQAIPPHEAGHAVIANHYGFKIKGIQSTPKFHREANLVSGAHVEIGSKEGKSLGLKDALTPEYRSVTAAGQAGAEKAGAADPEFGTGGDRMQNAVSSILSGKLPGGAWKAAKNDAASLLEGPLAEQHAKLSQLLKERQASGQPITEKDFRNILRMVGFQGNPDSVLSTIGGLGSVVKEKAQQVVQKITSSPASPSAPPTNTDKRSQSENKPPFSFKQYLASNAHQYDNPQELQAAAKEAGRQAEQAGHPVIS